MPADVLARGKRKSLDRGPASHLECSFEIGLGGVAYHAAIVGHHAQQLVKLPLNRGNIRIDVGMIVFEVVQNRGTRPVVNELGALVEEGRIVFVRFNDKVRARTQTRGGVEIRRYAANQE